MKLGTWLGLAALVCAAGCSSSGKKTANQGDSKAVSEALTTGIEIDHGKKLAGVIPKPTATDVDVQQQDDAPLMLAPTGGDSIMSLDADNPDEDTDPVTAMLMQFADSNEHIEAAVEPSASDGGMADAGTTTKHYEVHFSVNDSICKNFCKGEFDGVMVQALKLKKGGITKHVERPFKLDCRDKGAETCEADKDKGSGNKDAGEDNGGGGSNADAGGGGSNDTGAYTGIQAYNSNLRNFSGQSCLCAKSKSKTFCEADGAGLSQKAVECVIDALNMDPAASNGWASCAASLVMNAAKTCGGATCADATTCEASAAVAAGERCTSKLPTDVQDAFDKCNLGTSPSSP